MSVRLALLLRICAVSSSLLLAAAFVASPVSATDSAREPRPTKVSADESAATDEARPRPRETPRATKSPEDKVTIGGLKAGGSGPWKPVRPARPTAARPTADQSSRKTNP
jgi:hypothetical protein